MRLKHHYSNLLLDLYEKLGDSHIAYCYQTNTVNQQQPFPSHSDSKTILSHVYSALDCYYTVIIQSCYHIGKYHCYRRDGSSLCNRINASYTAISFATLQSDIDLCSRKDSTLSSSRYCLFCMS